MSFELSYSHPEKGLQIIPLDQPTLKMGSLLSNQAVVEGEGVEPIHAVIEERDKQWVVMDVSESGIKLNGKAISSDTILKSGDVLSLGKVSLSFNESAPPVSSKKKTSEKPEERGERRAIGSLFTPRTAESVGDVLEVVAYWTNQVLEVEHYHPSFKNFSKVLIGDSSKVPFLAAGEKNLSSYLLAEVNPSGYSLNLLEGMTARVRSAKGVKELKTGHYQLTKKDIAHVRYGPIHYFLNFTRPPILQLPKEEMKDPLLFVISAFMIVLYLIIALGLAFTDPAKLHPEDEDIWSTVQAEKIPEIPKPEEKPQIIVEEVKAPPPPEAVPPPPPKPVEPVQPKEPAKPKEALKPKPVPRPVETLTKAKTQPPPAAPKEKPVQFGNEQPGAPRAGKEETNVKGAEADNTKPSAPNLDKLGIGVGKIASVGGAGAIATNFKNSAGGAGGGSGTAPKTLGLGGIEAGKSLGIAGSASAVSQFGGAKMVNEQDVGKAFKGARELNVNVRAGDPVISGGLTQEEVTQVVNKNINQIRHCYNRLLQKEPGAAGTVKVRATIGANGRVLAADIEKSTFTDAEMNNCISTVVKHWQFPQPRGGKEVKFAYPFQLSPVN